jgi:hypothetical protein
VAGNPALSGSVQVSPTSAGETSSGPFPRSSDLVRFHGDCDRFVVAANNFEEEADSFAA